MRVTVVADVQGGDIVQRLPPKYLGRAPLPLAAKAGSFTLLLIDSGQRVVTSSLLLRALEKARVSLPSPRALVVCGYNFTEEVRATLASAACFWVAENDGHWTDDSYRRVRQPAAHAEDDTKGRAKGRRGG